MALLHSKLYLQHCTVAQVESYYLQPEMEPWIVHRLLVLIRYFLIKMHELTTALATVNHARAAGS